MIVDFHSHTNASDGTLPALELIALMRARGVGVFSITDHDTLDAYATFDRMAQDATVITGVEINTSYRGNDVHVLGYRLPLHDTRLTRLLKDHRAARRTRAHAMVAKLQAAGAPITFEMVASEAAEGAALGRPHVAKALVRHGVVKDIEAAFRQWLTWGKPGHVPQDHITPQLAIRLIHEAGGVAVLAHPGRLQDETIIDELGPSLDGLEVFYPKHSSAQIHFYRGKAAQYGLVMSGGSDFHDIRWNTRGVGMDVGEADIAPFLELVCAKPQDTASPAP